MVRKTRKPCNWKHYICHFASEQGGQTITLFTLCRISRKAEGTPFAANPSAAMSAKSGLHDLDFLRPVVTFFVRLSAVDGWLCHLSKSLIAATGWQILFQ